MKSILWPIAKAILLVSLAISNLALLGVLYDSDGLAIYNLYQSGQLQYLQQLPGSGADDDVALFALLCINVLCWPILAVLPKHPVLGACAGVCMGLQVLCLSWIETDSAYRILVDTLHYTNNGYLWGWFVCEMVFVSASVVILFLPQADA